MIDERPDLEVTVETKTFGIKLFLLTAIPLQDFSSCAKVTQSIEMVTQLELLIACYARHNESAQLKNRIDHAPAVLHGRPGLERPVRSSIL